MMRDAQDIIAGDPFASIDAAFEPLAREALVFRLQDGMAIPCSGSVFADAEIDPLTSGAMDSEIEQISIHLPSSSWHRVQRIVRGDAVERQQYHKKYRVSKVSNDVIGIIVTARRDG